MSVKSEIEAMRIVFWGTYDLGKPRNRILLRGLRENEVEVVECHADVWSGIEDKSQVTGWGRRFMLLLRWIFAYPGLIVRYLRLPKHDAVIVGYPGQVDVLVLWPFARLRRVPVVLDAFLSLYNTVVEDRAIVGPSHPVARLLYGLEWLACRAAHRVVLDTKAHAEYFETTYRLSSRRTAAVFVGVEPEAFPPRGAGKSDRPPDAPVTVLFYGQFIPLHGVETIVRAARTTGDLAVEWVLIGQGQEEAKIRRMLKDRPVKNLTWIPWVDYGELKDWIARADICLGIFGDTGKAARVIPNKVFQVLAAGAPLITRDSPAIRELVNDETPGVCLVPPGDPAALADAVQRFGKERVHFAGTMLHGGLRTLIAPIASGAKLVRLLQEMRES